MAQLPQRIEQIRIAHAALIHHVVMGCANAEARQQLMPMLKVARENGWNELVDRIQLVLTGRREAALLNGLDEEDTVILQAILQGLQDPATLPDLNQQADPAQAAPGLAQMIHAACTGDAKALQAVAFMAEQMTNTQGDLRLLGGSMKRLVDGERNPEVLCKGMSAQGRQLVQNLIDELNQLASH